MGLFLIQMIISIDSCTFGAPPSGPLIHFIYSSNLAKSNPEFLSMPFAALVEGISSEVGEDKPPKGALDLLFDFVFRERRTLSEVGELTT